MEPGAVPDHYECLGVSPKAPPEVIRAAYVALAKLHHPDGPTPDEERMKQVNQAWNVLRVPADRAAYDAERADGAAAQAQAHAEPSAADPSPAGPPWAEDHLRTEPPRDPFATGPPWAEDVRAEPAGDPSGRGSPWAEAERAGPSSAWAGNGDPARAAAGGDGGSAGAGGDGWGAPTLGRSGWGEPIHGHHGGDETAGNGWGERPAADAAWSDPTAAGSGSETGWRETPETVPGDGSAPWARAGWHDTAQTVAGDDPAPWAHRVAPDPAPTPGGWGEPDWAGAAGGWGETVEDDPWGAAPTPATYPDARFGPEGVADQWGDHPADGEDGWHLVPHDPTAVLGRRGVAFVVDVAAVALPVLALVTTADVPVRAVAMVAAVLFAGIHVVLEGLTGSTPGKALVRVRTVRQSGEVPGVARALVRSVLWVVDGFPWLPAVGYHVAQRSGGHRRLGDLAARTFVVRREDAGYPLVTVAPEDLDGLVTDRG